MKIIFTLIIVILTFHSIGQKSDSLFVSTSEVKSFFHDTRKIINGGKDFFYLCDKPTNISFPINTKKLRQFLKTFSLDSFFTKNDIEVIVKQIKQSKGVVWKSLYIDSTIFLRRSYMDSIFHSPDPIIRKGFKLPVHYFLTFPLFSKDKLNCYIDAWYWCGRVCGQQTTYIFKFVKGHWVIHRIFYGAVS